MCRVHSFSVCSNSGRDTFQNVKVVTFCLLPSCHFTQVVKRLVMYDNDNNRLLVWFSVALDFLEPLNWIWNFSIFISHKLSRPTPPHQVVNGEWMTTSTVTKSPKSESETRKVKVGYYSPLSKRVETTMTSKTILDPPDFALLFSSNALKSLHTEATRPPQ